MEIAGLKRDLPLCAITDDLYIAAFICFGDAEITTACATELLKLVPREECWPMRWRARVMPRSISSQEKA